MSPEWTGFMAGIFSGTTKLIVGHPFGNYFHSCNHLNHIKKDTIKVRLQTQGSQGRFKGPLDCIIKTIQKEGVLAFCIL